MFIVNTREMLSRPSTKFINKDVGISKYRFYLENSRGLICVDKPKTIQIFSILAHIIFPIESPVCPFTNAVIAVTSSGSEVPRATRVRLSLIQSKHNPPHIVI